MSEAARKARSPGRGEAQRDVAASVPSADGALVLVVDDDEAVRDAVAISLRAAGFAVASFDSARQFLDNCPAGQRGCLVVDLDMAGVESELLPRLAAAERALPVIVTSRRLRRRTLSPALSGLAAVLLEKPFGVDDLLPLIRAAIPPLRDST